MQTSFSCFGRTSEEVANTLTHLIGIVFAFVTAYLLLTRCAEGSWQELFGMAVFSAAMLFMYTASTIYHWTLPGKAKRVLRYFDHICIYVLIAGSYTPIWLCVVGGTWGWVAFGLMWGVAVAGAIGKLVALGKHPRLSLTIYLVMGWSAVFAVVPIWKAMSATSLLWLLAEGIFYSSGTYFYAHDDKRPFFHAVCHLFVLGGTVSHFMALWTLMA